MNAARGALSWQNWKSRWPNAAASRFVDAGGLRWHVQVSGAGPVLLLVHGTGGATHSWRDLLPALAATHTVVAPDLPGHAFTERPRDDHALDLPGMAAGIHELLRVLGVSPRAIVGHSAGTAIALQLCADGFATPDVVVGLNAALAPPAPWAESLRIVSGPLTRWDGFAAAASALASLTPFADTTIASTGTRLPPAQLALYRALLGSPRHVGSVLAMMSQWQLPPLIARLPGIPLPVVLAASPTDRWIAPDETRRAASGLPHLTSVTLAGAGHLAHEADPVDAVKVIEAATRAAGS